MNACSAHGLVRCLTNYDAFCHRSKFREIDWKNVNRLSRADSVEIGEPLSINSGEFGQLSD